MQSITTEIHSGKFHITLFPVVERSESNPAGIFSVLHSICNQSAKLNIVAPRQTLNQLLYIEDFKISRSIEMNIMIRLGELLLLMIFFGSIGDVIEGSG